MSETNWWEHLGNEICNLGQRVHHHLMCIRMYINKDNLLKVIKLVHKNIETDFKYLTSVPQDYLFTNVCFFAIFPSLYEHCWVSHTQVHTYNNHTHLYLSIYHISIPIYRWNIHIYVYYVLEMMFQAFSDLQGMEQIKKEDPSFFII